MNNPRIKAWLSLIVSIALIGIALFLAAGTIQYWQAWIFLVATSVSRMSP